MINSIKRPFGLAIHGGAGTLLRTEMNVAMQQQYEKGLEDALNAGYAVLDAGGPSEDAVEAAVVMMEDCPLFNAGRGAVFNERGMHEMDAAIMCGRNRAAGATAGVGHVKNPVKLAKAIMQHTEHVMLIGEGAEAFAAAQGLSIESEPYFYTDLRYRQWQEAAEAGTVLLDHNGRKMGTVGAVALDQQGNLAAATSTGGMTNKQWGRVGDTPLIGVGTYADNETCAVSCTGHGEVFMRWVVAYDVACLMAYKGMPLGEACDMVVHDKLVKAGGEGGLIAINREGKICMPFNSAGMYRGQKSSDGTTIIAIYAD